MLVESASFFGFSHFYQTLHIYPEHRAQPTISKFRRINQCRQHTHTHRESKSHIRPMGKEDKKERNLTPLCVSMETRSSTKIEEHYTERIERVVPYVCMCVCESISHQNHLYSHREHTCNCTIGNE